MASTPCVIMTAPPMKVRRKASFRARMRSALESVVLVMAKSPEVEGKGSRSPGADRAQNERGDPKAAPMRFGNGLRRGRHLPETRNSGWGTAMFLGRLLNAGYSG